MSVTSKSNYKLQDNKMVVRLNLNIPLEFEIDLQTMNHEESNQFNHQKSLKAINAKSDLIIDKINNANFEQTIKVISNKLATEILDIHNPEEKLNTQAEKNILNTSIEAGTEILDIHNPEEKLNTQVETNILNTSMNVENDLQSNQEVIYNTKKRIKISIADYLNDSLTMAVNLMGSILFLGKLANYSWE